jgi:hypothetical protein
MPLLLCDERVGDRAMKFEAGFWATGFKSLPLGIMAHDPGVVNGSRFPPASPKPFAVVKTRTAEF